MNPKSSSILTALLMASIFGAIIEVGFCREFGIVTLKKLGGIRDFQSSEIDSIARFAVQEHNKRANTLLEFGKVLKAKEQVVAGKVYHLTLEAIDAGNKKVYEAKVWVKPWMNFKQLQEFKQHAMEISHFTTSDLGILRDRLGWHKVPIHDPEVKDAADHALRIIQQRSNALFPYQLIEILQAEAEVVKDFVKYNLLLKLRRGTEDVKLKVKVHKTADGNFLLNTMEHPDL